MRERDTRGQDAGRSELHMERLEAVAAVIRAHGAASVLDLGCGSGSLLAHLAEGGGLTRLVGVDASLVALEEAERALAPLRAAGAAEIALLHGSVLERGSDWPRVDAVTLVETIEHLPPGELHRLERALFAPPLAPLVVITTPNRDCNPLLGVPPGRLRHADHHFEWGRARFQAWAGGMGERHGYAAAFEGIGRGDAWHGRPTQMAVLSRSGS